MLSPLDDVVHARQTMRHIDYVVTRSVPQAEQCISPPDNTANFQPNICVSTRCVAQAEQAAGMSAAAATWQGCWSGYWV
jgi:hypothetical protein